MQQHYEKTIGYEVILNYEYLFKRTSKSFIKTFQNIIDQWFPAYWLLI